jgi:hypothetical protein
MHPLRIKNTKDFKLMRKTPLSDGFLTKWERISNIAEALKRLELQAADEGCRKLRRKIEDARNEATKKSLSVQGSRMYLDKINDLVDM